MRVLSIIDSFKGTVTSIELGKIISNVLNNKGVKADYLPISDGGDGFLDAIEKIVLSKRILIKVKNPLGKEIQSYFLLDKNKTAYIEMAMSSGISLLNKEELDPYITSTFGLGETIDHAIKMGVKEIVVGLGGSATNDGGSGMLEALGCRFFDKNHEIITDINGSKIDQIEYIDSTNFFKKIKNINFLILSDVTNPLLYENGATYVFAKQKGASSEDIEILEEKMKSYSLSIERHVGKSLHLSEGSGAAGGVGFAFYSMFDAKLVSGINYILDMMDFNNMLNKYDYIITGEGKIDNQSLNGKVIFEISKRAKDKKIILVCAINEVDEITLRSRNIKSIYSIVGNNVTIEESIKNSRFYFEQLCERIIF